MTACTDCSAGAYSNDAASFCVPCANGKFSPGAASSCSDCDAGKYSTGGTEACTDCAAGRYADAGSTLCTPCAIGKFSPATAESCTNCDAGKYSLGEAASCDDCTAGLYSDVSSLTCQPCASGTFSATAAASCYACAVGKYRLMQTDGCADCSAGTYAATEGNAACSVCGPGEFSPAAAVTCTDCVPGTHSIGAASSCTDCSAGKYSDTPHTIDCSGCTRGTFSNASATACTDCPSGKYSPGDTSYCYDLAIDFEVCPVHVENSNVLENDCYYKYQGAYREKDEGEASPFGASCRELAKCRHEHTELSDKYYMVCMECAEGAMPLGLNTEADGSCEAGRFPQFCINQSELGTCPSDPLKDDDCHYFYQADWEEVGGGQTSPFGDSCATHTACNADFSETKNEFWMICSEVRRRRTEFYIPCPLFTLTHVHDSHVSTACSAPTACGRILPPSPRAPGAATARAFRSATVPRSSRAAPTRGAPRRTC